MKINKAGFTIVEALVTLAILGAALAGAISLLELVSKTMATQKYLNENLNATREIRAILAQVGACQQTFAGTALNASTAAAITQVKDQNGIVVYDTTALKYGDRSFTITSMVLSNYLDVTPPVGRATLTIKYTSSTQVMGSQILPSSINIQTRKDGSNNLVDCVALAGMSDGIWQLVPNTAWDIFYAGGNVGVGTNAPVTSLDVHGQVRAAQGAPSAGDASTNGGFAFGGDGDTGMFSPGVATPINGTLAFVNNNVETMRLTASNYLGVGTPSPQMKLDVAGGMRLGADSTLCTVQVEGAMRYNSAIKSMEVCNATGWVSILGSRTVVLGAGQITHGTWPIYNGYTHCANIHYRPWTQGKVLPIGNMSYGGNSPPPFGTFSDFTVFFVQLDPSVGGGLACLSSNTFNGQVQSEDLDWIVYGSY